MPLSAKQQQAQGLRLGGYFAFFVALLSSINWLLIVHEDYVMEHQWPAVPGTIYSATERWREVIPPSISSPHYQVYWTEFMVILNLPAERCLGTMIELEGQPRCTGEAKTPEVRSPSDAEQWSVRHPRESKVIVHYDTQSGRMVLGGESILNVYPWRKIGTTAIIFAVGAFLFGLGRSWAIEPEPAGVDVK
jgi:hypothetical protein